ncbi:MAG: hypothetical protein H0T21_01555 [Gemmatimonadaceae bacterium]|nr:hypothetical protein [Gemmatimonadaceae bacterium]
MTSGSVDTSGESRGRGVTSVTTGALGGGAARTVVAAPSTTGGTPLRSFVLTDR